MASLAQGVLVLGSGTIWAVEELPGLGGVQIQRDAGILRAHSVPGPKPEPQPPRPNPWREKKDTLERLQQYRQAGGLGCLEAVAGRCGGDLTADKLRGVLTGAEKLSIEQWRTKAREITVRAGRARKRRAWARHSQRERRERRGPRSHDSGGYGICRNIQPDF